MRPFRNKLRLSLVLLCLLLSNPGAFGHIKGGLYREETSLGLSCIYKFQTNGVGLGLRGHFYINQRLSAVPQIAYFPTFNTIHEFSAGVNAHFYFFKVKSVKGYVLAGGIYDHWLNFDDSSYKKAKINNIIPTTGGGIVIEEKCYKTFIEFQYYPIWLEGNIRIGVLWFPKCTFKAAKHKIIKCSIFF